MTGSGVGATYDQARDVLWLLDKRRWTSRPTRRVRARSTSTAKTAGMARAEHYMKYPGTRASTAAAPVAPTT